MGGRLGFRILRGGLCCPPTWLRLVVSHQTAPGAWLRLAAPPTWLRLAVSHLTAPGCPWCLAAPGWVLLAVPGCPWPNGFSGVAPAVFRDNCSQADQPGNYFSKCSQGCIFSTSIIIIISSSHHHHQHHHHRTNVHPPSWAKPGPHAAPVCMNSGTNVHPPCGRMAAKPG